MLGVISLIALILSAWGLRGLPGSRRQPLDPRTVILRYRAIFRIPTARICYLTVLCEGIFVMGLFAYVAVLLLEAGEPRASIAGAVIASFAVGGIVYSIGIGALLRLLGQKWVMIAGGLFMAFGIAGLAFAPPWQVQCLVVAIMGLGFYMLHASIQVFVTELAPATRSSAIAFHTFSIFVGQSIGTAAFGYGLFYLGAPATLAICSATIALTGIIAAQLLTRHRFDLGFCAFQAAGRTNTMRAGEDDLCGGAMPSLCSAAQVCSGPPQRLHNKPNLGAFFGFRQKRSPIRSWMVSAMGCANAATWKAKTSCWSCVTRPVILRLCARCYPN